MFLHTWLNIGSWVMLYRFNSLLSLYNFALNVFNLIANLLEQRQHSNSLTNLKEFCKDKSTYPLTIRQKWTFYQVYFQIYIIFQSHFTHLNSFFNVSVCNTESRFLCNIFSTKIFLYELFKGILQNSYFDKTFMTSISVVIL